MLKFTKGLLLFALATLALTFHVNDLKASSDNLIQEGVPERHPDGRIIATLRSLGGCGDNPGNVFHGSYTCPIYDEGGILRGEVAATLDFLEFILDGGYLKISALDISPNYISPPTMIAMSDVHDPMVPEEFKDNPDFSMMTFTGRMSVKPGTGTLRNVSKLDFRCVFIVENATGNVAYSLNRYYIFT